MQAEAAIVTEGLTKRFGATVALDHLDLRVERTEVLGLLGPNGAGKTTTIRLLLGLVRPSAGRCRLFGLDCHHSTVAAHRHVGYVPGDAALWPGLTGAETLHLLGRLHGYVDAGYRDELVERFALDPSKKVRAYSKDNRQKVVLIAALMFRDCLGEAQGNGQTVLLSSHILSEVEAVCDRVAILRRGRMVEMSSLEDLRRLSALDVEIGFAGPVPELGDLPGVNDLDVDGRRVHCPVSGSLDPLIERLATARVSGHGRLRTIWRPWAGTPRGSARRSCRRSPPPSGS